VREIHRDIKSSNYRIAIDANNPLNIILHLVDRDFATELPSRKSKLISENAPYRITPGFNAPETVSKKELSCKADIYSLGVLLGDELKLTSSQTIISNPAKAVIAAMKNASAEKRPEIHEVVSNLWNELPSSLRNAGYLRDTKIAVERLQLLAAARKTVDHFNKSPPFCRYFLWRRHQSQQDLFLLQLTNAVKIAENSFSLSNENLVILFTDALNTSPSATFPLSRSMHFLGKNLLGNNFKGSPEQLRQMLYDKVNALKEPIENEQSSYLRKNICV